MFPFDSVLDYFCPVLQVSSRHPSALAVLLALRQALLRQVIIATFPCLPHLLLVSAHLVQGIHPSDCPPRLYHADSSELGSAQF